VRGLRARLAGRRAARSLHVAETRVSGTVKPGFRLLREPGGCPEARGRAAALRFVVADRGR